MKEMVVVFLNRSKFEVPEDLDYTGFRVALGVPNGRPLYLKDGRNYVEVTASNFVLKPGQHYIDMPDWIEGETLAGLPPLLAEDIAALIGEYGEEKVKVEVAGEQRWNLVLSGFPVAPGFRGQFGEGVIRLPVDASYPQSAINGIHLILPNGETVTQCFNCQSWNPQRDSIQTYLCAVQNWMRGKVNA